MSQIKEKVPCGAATPQDTSDCTTSVQFNNTPFSSGCKEGIFNDPLLSQVLENVEFFCRLGADGGISDDFEECLGTMGDDLWPQIKRITQSRQVCTAIEFNNPRAIDYLEHITYLCFEAYRKGRMEYRHAAII